MHSLPAINLPSRPGKGPKPLQEFDALSRAIIDEWELRRAQKGQLAPSKSAIGFLKREAYRVIIHYVAHGQASFFERVIRDDGRGLTSRVRLDENPFHYGLLALFSDDSVVSRQDRSVFASQMLYAYHHGVPPAFLIGFIYQAGSKEDIKRKLREGCVEDGFEATHKRYLKDVKMGTFR